MADMKNVAQIIRFVNLVVVLASPWRIHSYHSVKKADTREGKLANTIL